MFLWRERMTILQLKFIFYWVTNNYEVKDIGGWHPTPERILEEYMDEFKVDEEKKEEDE